jgi:Gpi16 subunit, GPI transamidase component
MSRSDATATSSSTYTERLVVTSLSSDEGHEIDDDDDASVVDGADRLDATPWPSKGRRRRAATFGVRLESVQRTTAAGLHQSLALPYGILRVFENLLTRHGAARISVQVHHKATTTSSPSYGPFLGNTSTLEDQEGDNDWLRSTSTSASAESESGPSGVSVHVDFRVASEASDRQIPSDPNAQRQDKLARDQAMRQILAELHARRILVAPILGVGAGTLPSFRHTSRLQPRPFLIRSSSTNSTFSNSHISTPTIITYTYALPTEGSPWSSEGMASFLDLMPCPAKDGGNDLGGARGAGWWSLGSAEDWSHFLLNTPTDARRSPRGDGRAAAAAIPSSKFTLAAEYPRRTWIEATAWYADQQQPSSELSSDTCSTTDQRIRGVSLSTGVEYAVSGPRQSSPDAPSLQSILPFVSASPEPATLAACPLADSTRLILVNGTYAKSETDQASESVAMEVGSLRTGPLNLSESISSLWEAEEESKGARELGPHPSIKSPRFPRPSAWQIGYTVERTSGQANSGTLRSTIGSSDPACPTVVEVHQVLPRVVSPVWQSLHVQLFNSTSSDPTILKWKDLDWTDGVQLDDDATGGVGTFRWSFRHTLPPRSTMVVVLEYEAAYLNFEQFPADPNRGFELPPFVARMTLACDDAISNGRPVHSTTLYSESPLLLAPIPDMSMPFNVISLTCTWYAFVVGSMVHLILRKGSERIKYGLHPELRPKPPLQKLKDTVKDRVGKLVTKWKGPKPDPSSDASKESAPKKSPPE